MSEQYDNRTDAEEVWARQWAADEKLQTEFNNKADYVAFRKADKAGLIRNRGREKQRQQTPS